jgi:hypothetical protein
MNPQTKSFAVFQRELKRRKVVRACVVYLLACWGGLKSADVILTFLKFNPDLASHTVVMAAILGLPITAVFSWFYDVSMSGITRRAPFVERRVLDNIAPLDDRRKEGPARGRRSRPESAYDWILEVESGPLAGQRYGLEGSVVIGRSADCDLTIPVPRISRQHARFVVEGNKLLLEDLNSSNGTSVNGARIKSTVTLNHQDKIELLDVTFKIKENLAHFHAQDSTVLQDVTQQRTGESLGSAAKS